MFGFKKDIDNLVRTHRAEVLELLVVLRKEIDILKNDMQLLKTNQNSLRGLMNRKLGGQEEREEEAENEPKHIKTTYY